MYIARFFFKPALSTLANIVASTCGVRLQIQLTILLLQSLRLHLFDANNYFTVAGDSLGLLTNFGPVGGLANPYFVSGVGVVNLSRS